MLLRFAYLAFCATLQFLVRGRRGEAEREAETPPAIARQRPSKRAEHNPIGERATRTGDLAAEHRQLVTQNQDLHRLAVVRSATQNEQLHEPPEHPVNDGSGHPPIAPATTRTTSHRVLGTHTHARIPSA
jgi:hypothetical protein